MIKKLLLTLLLTASFSQAAVLITLSTNPTTGIAFTSTAGVLPDGSLVRIGTFTTTPAAGATFESLASSFREFGTTTSGHSNASGANKGMIGRTNIAGASGGPDDASFIGAEVYIWAYASPTADPNAPQGIYRAYDAAAVPAVAKFADQTAALSISTTKLLDAYGTFAPNGTAAAVNRSGNVITGATLGVPIPEPSTITGGVALALLGLVRRRR